MKTLNEFIEESSLARVWQHARKHSVGTITAFRSARECGDGKPYTKNENLERNRILRAKLLKLGYSITKIKGTYVEFYGSSKAKEVNEDSFLVVDIKDSGRLLKDLLALGEEFEQDSITFQEDTAVGYYLISSNRCPDAYPGKGKVGYRKRLGRAIFGDKGEFHSKVNGRPFVFEEVGEYLQSFDRLSITEKRGVVELSKQDGGSTCLFD